MTQARKSRRDLLGDRALRKPGRCRALRASRPPGRTRECVRTARSTMRGSGAGPAGANSRNACPAGVWIYASRSSFDCMRSRILVCTSVCTRDCRSQRRYAMACRADASPQESRVMKKMNSPVPASTPPAAPAGSGLAGYLADRRRRPGCARSPDAASERPQARIRGQVVGPLQKRRIGLQHAAKLGAAARAVLEPVPGESALCE